jgi:hypothetical protein
MSDFNAALAAFIDSVNEDGEAYYAEKLKNLTYSPKFVEGGRKYLKIADCSNAGGKTVYCFVATEDVPAKNVKRGDILKAAGWKAPELSRKNPAAGNIFEPASYENKNKAYGGWLYSA